MAVIIRHLDLAGGPAHVAVYSGNEDETPSSPRAALSKVPSRRRQNRGRALPRGERGAAEPRPRRAELVVAFW